MIQDNPEFRNSAIAKCAHMPIGILYSDTLIAKERHEILEAKLRDLAYAHQDLRDRMDQRAELLLEMDSAYLSLRHQTDEDEIERRKYALSQQGDDLRRLNDKIDEIKKSTHKRRRELVNLLQDWT